MVSSVTDAMLRYSLQNSQQPPKASMQNFTWNGFGCDAVPSRVLGLYALPSGSFVVARVSISVFEVDNSSSSKVTAKRAGRFCNVLTLMAPENKPPTAECHDAS